MKLRFQADNDLDQRIVVATKRLDPAIDFRTAAALGLHHVPDPEVLALAAGEGRVLVSHDRRTLPGHFRQYTSSHTSPGLSSCRRSWRWAGPPSCSTCCGRRARPRSM